LCAGTAPAARRVAVVGCSGSGKTTLAAALARALGAPHVELDAIYHRPGWTPLPDEQFRARVAEVTAQGHWVVDGNYKVVQDIVWDHADAVVWFDLPFARVMSRTVGRTVRRTFTREELWNGNKEPFSNLWSLNPERSIIMWAATRHRVYRRRYAEAERDPRWAHLRFVRLRSQAEVDAFLAAVTSSTVAEFGGASRSERGVSPE
jgi:adenylate kinase family enzyme